MKSLLALTLILFFSLPSFCQFQKEAEYPSSQVLRVLLQDQSERYLYFDEENSQIKVANGSHQDIDSLPAPDCEGTFTISSARNDFEETELGVLCYCYTFSDDDGPDFDYQLIDLDGNSMIDFNTFITMDDNHIIDFNKDEFQSTVYNTQSLEVITVESQLKLIEADARHNDEKFYFGHNGKDSILVFDESMSKIKSISFEFESNENIIRLFGASTNASGQTQFYFRVSEIESIFSDALYNKLIDETGSTLEEFDSGFSFYKFEQNLQVLAFGQQGILKYNIQNDEFKTISFPISGFATTFQSGKYSIAKYATISGLLEFFDSDFEISNLAEIESNLDLRLDYFFDDEGNEYLWYSPFSGSSNYSSIYKNNINLQRIENSSEIISSKLQNLPLKLLSIGPFGTEITEVYSMLPTGTHDLDESVFSLSPNPVSNELRISSDQEFESYIIFDNTAKVVQRKSIFVNDFNIDVSQLNPGIYFLRLQSTDNQTEAKKFIKIK